MHMHSGDKLSYREESAHHNSANETAKITSFFVHTLLHQYCRQNLLNSLTELPTVSSTKVRNFGQPGWPDIRFLDSVSLTKIPTC